MTEMRRMIQKRLGRTTLFLSIAAVSVIGIPLSALGAVQNPTASAKISFTFDDGFASALTQAAPTLSKYGVSGTIYIPTSCIGTVGTCRANPSGTYLTWAQVKTLQNTHKWEIGSHTVTHPCLVSIGGDCQAAKLTTAQVTQELAQSKAALAAQGFTALSFATPYGDYDNGVLALIAKYYTSHRGFADRKNNLWPFNDYLLNNFPVNTGVTVAQVKVRIDQAIANKEWLVLTFHDIKVTPSTNPEDEEFSTANLDQIAAYVKTKVDSKQIEALNVQKGSVTSDVNFLANSTFNNGIATGWTTDSPTTITKDIGTNGSYPDPMSSIKLVSTTKSVHLFSPQVSVSSSDKYIIKSFLNVRTISSGEVGFYIDEYNASGNWISGQYKVGERSAFVENIGFMYVPTSPAVVKARLQVIVTANVGITAFLDNVQWFSLTDTTPIPPPAPTNLVVNGTFDNGIANGWTADDPVNITKDINNNGSPANPVNSIKLLGTTRHIHLLSPQVTVDSTKRYTLSSYLDLRKITSGVFAYYIDEYDASGNWMSGQYKWERSTAVKGEVLLNYAPSSAQVKRANLQIIAVGNSGIEAYFDNVTWYQD